MAEEKKTKMAEEKKEVKNHSETHTHEHKHESSNEVKNETAKENKEVKAESKETPKENIKEKPKVKKDFAVVNAYGVHMSKRHGMYICSFIKGKTIESAISDLEQVILLKKAVPFKGEIPHRKGMMSGRYPVDAAKIFIPMLKNLKGGVLYNGMDITKTRIHTAYANFAYRPQKRGGTKGKRASIKIEARELK